MNATQNSQVLNLKVTEELSVNVIPNENYEFLMTTKEVANAYGVTEYAVRKTLLRNSEDLKDGKHVIRGAELISDKGGTNCPTLDNAQPHQVFWTKRGIVRLGFFIKSLRAKLFRDWAEELILNVIDNGENFLQPVPVLQAPKKRNHNRLTQERMISVLADVAKIEDSELRLRLIEKLGL